ncbi:MAG: hypothetical protein ABIJ08_05510 [Nanoarchaeota archaeon]
MRKIILFGLFITLLISLASFASAWNLLDDCSTMGEGWFNETGVLGSTVTVVNGQCTLTRTNDDVIAAGKLQSVAGQDYEWKMLAKHTETGASVYFGFGSDAPDTLDYFIWNGWFSAPGGTSAVNGSYINYDFARLKFNKWYWYRTQYNGSHYRFRYWSNKSIEDDYFADDSVWNLTKEILYDQASDSRFELSFAGSGGGIGVLSVEEIYYQSLGGSDTTPPIISDVNCTSVIPDGDAQSPYTTYDTTPTFSFTTDENAYCRISDEDQNYTTMGNSRNCSTGEGTTTHTCTISVEDELYIPTDYAYVACTDANGNENITSSKALLMDITDLETNTSKAIDLGIQSSTIWSTTVHNSQQIYLRDMDNNQLLTTVDRVAIFNSQRWLLNYVVDGSLLGLFNITPAIYVLDMTNISMTQIEHQVSGLINSTKS